LGDRQDHEDNIDKYGTQQVQRIKTGTNGPDIGESKDNPESVEQSGVFDVPFRFVSGWLRRDQVKWDGVWMRDRAHPAIVSRELIVSPAWENGVDNHKYAGVDA